jgi:hypothetical protein
MTAIRNTGSGTPLVVPGDPPDVASVRRSEPPVLDTPTSEPLDAFATAGDRPAPLLDATVVNGRPGGVLGTFAAHQATGRDAVQAELSAVRAKLALAAQALPDAGVAPAQHALEVSAERVLTALDAGRITLDEAVRAAHMLAEMTGALLAIEQGRCRVSAVAVPDQPGVVSFDVRTEDNDVLRVTARLEGTAAGQARLKFYNVVDDGAQVTAEHKMMVRFDLEGSEQTDAPLHTAIDVQLGHEKNPGHERLNNRVHGVLVDDTGQPVRNRLGNTVPDHHFGEVPDSLHDRQGFRVFVQRFLDDLNAQAGSPP